MKTLLLSCCAPCSCSVIEKMSQEGQNFAVLFYNPNICPEEEYQKRLEENKKICLLYGVEFVELEYDNSHWKDMIKGLENEPERGKRCDVCFYMRIKRAMQYAKQNGFDVVGSVLGVSRYKDLLQVNRAGQKASSEEGVEYVEIEGRRLGLQERRTQLTKELGLYSQDYCGCKPRG